MSLYKLGKAYGNYLEKSIEFTKSNLDSVKKMSAFDSIASLMFSTSVILNYTFESFLYKGIEPWLYASSATCLTGAIITNLLVGKVGNDLENKCAEQSKLEHFKSLPINKTGVDYLKVAK